MMIAWLVENLPEYRESEECDIRIWNLKEDTFSVKSLNKILQKSRCLELGIGFPNFPKDRVWNEVTPTKISIVLWLILIGKLPVTMHLKSVFALASRCPMCRESEETVMHLFFYCPIAQSCWSFFANAFGSPPMTWQSFLGRWDSWESRRHSPQSSAIWRYTFQSVIWGLWRERNERIFNDKARNMDQVRADILGFLWRQVGHKPSMRNVQFDTFIASFNSVVAL